MRMRWLTSPSLRRHGKGYTEATRSGPNQTGSGGENEKGEERCGSVGGGLVRWGRAPWWQGTMGTEGVGASEPSDRGVRLGRRWSSQHEG